MDQEQQKIKIGQNIAEFRRRAGLTQLELADKLNYSDKAVSKWERGESIPDVLTLLQMSQVLDVSLDQLVHGSPLLKKPKLPKIRRYKADKRVVQMLCSLLVWFLGLLVYVVLSSCGVPKSWIAFAYCVPVNAVVLLCLRSAWRKFNWNKSLISMIVWGVVAGFWLTMLVFARVNLWRVFLLGIVGQIAVFLWFKMLRPVQEEEVENGQE